MQQSSKNISVAILGGYGSFHHLAANKFFSAKNITLVPFETFLELFIAIKTNSVDYAVVAVENTIAGSLAVNYPLMITADVNIISELWLPVKHNLITLPGTALSMITEIHSHPVAILQCHDFLEPLINKGVKIVETSNTALSVKYIHDTNALNVAAIGSIVAASLYRLDILAENINTNIINNTRFLILSGSSQKTKDQFGENCKEFNKATVLFSPITSEGLIYHLFKLLNDGCCKITHLLSLPVSNSLRSQQFIADIVYNDISVFENIMCLAITYNYQVKMLGKYIHMQQQMCELKELQTIEEV
ncbi:MAG TPA: prephenate dehydratase domain-containing protein [Flavipsychrobacter sp.]|nr:prephenate dehydratase domain-containing protein [Flavipsychrobacter sp.]